MMRARSRIKPEIGQEQCGFVKDSGTRNAIFILRMLTERAIEMQKDLYICYIDYTKAFDKVRHEELMKILSELDIDGKDIRIVRNLYWEQTAGIRIEGEISDFVKIERGVRQGCVFSPDLFNLYSEKILRELDGVAGFIIGGHNANNLRYADDTALLADSEEKLQTLLNKVVEESKKKGLSINCKKTECMVVSKTISPQCQLHIGETIIKKVKSFNYLGSLITEDGKCDSEIRRRIGFAKDVFQRLGNVLKNNNISMDTRKRILKCYVLSILTYGSECWTISQLMEARLEAAEMWFLRRMLKIPWTDRVSNEEILRRSNGQRSLLKAIRKGQMEFLGHVMRKGGLENLSLTGRIQGKRARGRQRMTYMESLCKWMNTQLRDGNVTVQKVLRTTSDRILWRAMIANVLKEQGT